MPSSLPGKWRSLLSKCAACIFLVSLGLVALLSGTDRISSDVLRSPSIEGWPYDTGASRSRAAHTLISTGPMPAIRHAERALLTDPLDSTVVGFLGRIQLVAGNETAAASAFKVSGQLGWHDTLTQIYWMEQALKVEDFKVAATRLDALLRQVPNIESREQLIGSVLQSAEGKIEIAKRIKLAPTWVPIFATPAPEATAAQIGGRAEVLQLAGRGALDCNTAGKLVNRLIRVNLVQPAQALWQANCMASPALVYDGGFDKLDTTQFATGFDWELTNRGDLDARITESQPGNRLLALTVNGPSTQLVVRQMVVLRPGRYRLNWRMPKTSAQSARALSVSLACTSDLAKAKAGQAAGPNDSYFVDFDVDNTCPSRRLTFWLAPKNPISLDDIVLRGFFGESASTAHD